MDIESGNEIESKSIFYETVNLQFPKMFNILSANETEIILKEKYRVTLNNVKLSLLELTSEINISKFVLSSDAAAILCGVQDSTFYMTLYGMFPIISVSIKPKLIEYALKSDGSKIALLQERNNEIAFKVVTIKNIQGIISAFSELLIIKSILAQLKLKLNAGKVSMNKIRMSFKVFLNHFKSAFLANGEDSLDQALTSLLFFGICTKPLSDIFAEKKVAQKKLNFLKSSLSKHLGELKSCQCNFLSPLLRLLNETFNNLKYQFKALDEDVLSDLKHVEAHLNNFCLSVEEISYILLEIEYFSIAIFDWFDRLFREREIKENEENSLKLKALLKENIKNPLPNLSIESILNWLNGDSERAPLFTFPKIYKMNMSEQPLTDIFSKLKELEKELEPLFKPLAITNPSDNWTQMDISSNCKTFSNIKYCDKDDDFYVYIRNENRNLVERVSLNTNETYTFDLPNSKCCSSIIPYKSDIILVEEDETKKTLKVMCENKENKNLINLCATRNFRKDYTEVTQYHFSDALNRIALISHAKQLLVYDLTKDEL